jgi:hypothetical protein
VVNVRRQRGVADAVASARNEQLHPNQSQKGLRLELGPCVCGRDAAEVHEYLRIKGPPAPSVRSRKAPPLPRPRPATPHSERTRHFPVQFIVPLLTDLASDWHTNVEMSIDCNSFPL